jgi:hypothetical protein
MMKLDLSTFFLSVAGAAHMGLGAQGKVDLELAAQNIELLELLKDKTKGNRTDDEDRLIDQLLFETRMRFVELQKKAGKK